MKVLCKANNLSFFNDENLLKRLREYIYMPDGEIDLIVNKEYMVYGVVFRDNSPWYYICVEDYDEYPKPFPAECFEIVDQKISKYWVLSTRCLEMGEVESSLVIKEWADNDSFYELLIEGDPATVKIFEQYKNYLNME